MSDKPILSAILGVIGGSAAAAAVTFLTSSRVERQKFDYAIIQQALQADSQGERESRLQFLMETGFIQDDGLKQRLITKLQQKAILPQLPAAAPPAMSANTEASISDDGLVSRFFSPLRKDRSAAFDEIVRRRSDDDVFLTQLIAEAKKHMTVAEGDLVITFFHILERFSDGALVRARPAVDEHLKAWDAVVASQPGEWGETAKAIKEARVRLQKLPTQ